MPIKRRKRRWLRWSLVLAGLVLLFLAFTRGLYFFPTTLALGPCLPDWTSPQLISHLKGERLSPMATVRFTAGAANVQVCYGRPSARGRTIFDDSTNPVLDRRSNRFVTPPGAREALVPYGRLWRTGANEPTRLFTDSPLQVGSNRLDPGRYAIYPIPGKDTWQVVLNRSTFHWGNRIPPSVREQEVGSLSVPSQEITEYVETFTMRPLVTSAGVLLVLEWGTRRIEIPLRG
jgi:hypothetical protein